MSLFSDFYVGTSGLQTSQEALNVVAHNVTNTDTTGYVRQQVSQATREYNTLNRQITGVAMKQTGLGTFIAEVRQVRDRFLDASYREEIGRQGFYDTAYGAIEEIEEIMGELDGATFYEAMDKMWTAVEELVKDPHSEVCQSMLVQYAQSFAEAAGNVYSSLSNYQDKLNLKVASSVERINEIGHEIYRLNEEIRGIESGKIENANDLKDRRNQMLDELSEYAKISYSEDFFGNVLVKLEGHDFVQMDKVNEMAYAVDESSGFNECYWPDMATSYYDAGGNRIYNADTAPVYDFTVPISSALDTDWGSLKSVILARGDHRGNWTDLQTSDAYDNVKESILMNVMAEFDGLVRNVCTSVNKVLEQSAENAQKTISKDSTYMCDENGNALKLFTRKATNDDPDKKIYGSAEGDIYYKDQIGTLSRTDGGSTTFKDEYGYTYTATCHFVDSNGLTVLKYSLSREDTRSYGTPGNSINYEALYSLDSDGNLVGDSTSWFAAVNVTVNQDLLQYPTHLGFINPDGSVDYETAKNMETAFQEKAFVLNPDLTNPINIRDYYSNLTAQIANSGNVYKSLKENQELTVEKVESTRQGTIGVSTDEELSNMIRFQNAYNASSRFINVIDECTEHLINTLGS